MSACRSQVCGVLVGSVLMLLATGCGGGPGEDAVSVKFKVTENGQPVSGPASNPLDSPEVAPENLKGEVYVLAVTKGEGNNRIGYGQQVVLQGGVVEFLLPLGKYEVTVTRQSLASLAGTGGGTPDEKSAEPQVLATKTIEVTADGQEIAVEIGK